MMPSPGLERTAQIIAENVVSALGREREGVGGIGPTGRQAAVAAIMADLLRAMPTDSGERLAQACNLYLDALAGLGVSGPRVETVDLADGSVKMRW